MAKTISEEELQLRKRARRRLIGAIALVTMIVVFLPMVLDHEPKPVNQDVSIQIPSPNSSTFTSKIVPVVPGAPAAPAAKPAPETPAQRIPAKSQVAASAPPAYDTEAAPPKKAAPDTPVPQPKPAAAVAAKPGAKSVPAPKAADKVQSGSKSAGGYVVQVAALNDAGKAKEMQGKIAAAGVKSYTEVVPTVKGNVTRVRAGPFATRDEAERIRDRLKEMGLNGNVSPK